ncbi:MAG: TIR domain-containing protein [Chloroflexi bacterium]|nr:MAG: TIR domain-containing protein [Chloroflexota bacterium]
MRSTEERPHSVNILYCYAVVKEDERLKNKLRHQFSILRRQKLINDWCTGDLKPGQNWKEAVERRLETAHLILLLISPDFMVSDYWHGIVMRAIERDGKGEAKVISILLRPTNITDAPFSHLRVLPEGRRPVSLGNVERACAEIVEAISPMIHDILGTSPIDELFEQLGVTDNTPKNRRNVRLAPPASNNGVARNRPSGQTPARPASNGQETGQMGE